MPLPRNHKSPPHLLTNLHLWPVKEWAILASRFGLVFINYLLLFWVHPFQLHYSWLAAYLPLFLTGYVLIGWLTARFVSYKAANLAFTLLDITLLSLGYYYLPDSVIRGLFPLYFIGIIVHIFYGGYLSSLLLAALACFCYGLAVFPRLATLNLISFYYQIANFLLTTLFICIIGIKTRHAIAQLETEQEASKRQLQRLQALSRITKEIASELEFEKLLMLISQKAADLTGSQASGIVLRDPDQCYRIKAAKGIPRAALHIEVKPEITLPGRVLASQKTLCEAGNLNPELAGLDLTNYRAALASPIWSKGEMIGVLFVLTDQPQHLYSKEEQLVLEMLGEQAAVAVVNANLFKIAATLSMNDYLTGVGNLRYFYQQLEKSLALSRRYQKSCALMIVDSDSLKQINDQYGNNQGFQHIKQLAEILKDTIRTTDLIARYDRDMFMIILPETGLDEAVNLGKRIQEKVVATPLAIGDIAVLSTVCIGIAEFHPTESGEPRTLVAAVETALQKAKSLGKNRLVALDTGATSGQLSSF